MSGFNLPPISSVVSAQALPDALPLQRARRQSESLAQIYFLPCRLKLGKRGVTIKLEESSGWRSLVREISAWPVGKWRTRAYSIRRDTGRSIAGNLGREKPEMPSYENRMKTHTYCTVGIVERLWSDTPHGAIASWPERKLPTQSVSNRNKDSVPGRNSAWSRVVGALPGG